MSELAILGGKPVRTSPFSRWPQHLPSDAARLQKVLESGHWGGFPVPNRYAKEFAEKFADFVFGVFQHPASVRSRRIHATAASIFTMHGT